MDKKHGEGQWPPNNKAERRNLHQNVGELHSLGMAHAYRGPRGDAGGDARAGAPQADLHAGLYLLSFRPRFTYFVTSCALWLHPPSYKNLLIFKDKCRHPKPLNRFYVIE